MKRCFASTLLITGLFAVTLMTGCSSRNIDSEELRDNWTPELHSTAATYDQYYNDRTIYRTNTMRQIYDDWANIWFEGRNLRMTRYPLP